jgi:4-hydroxybenzoate polyprenyltransferase
MKHLFPAGGGAEEGRKGSGLQRLKLFLALSRTPHGLLDMATPGLAALLWLGALPPPLTIVLGLVTVFAGYTAVYALNDIVDFRSDREKIQGGGFRDSDNYLDAAILRHPLARGLLGFREALVWGISWGLLALVGAYLLNPLCVLFFAAGCLLEIFYCLMWRVTPLRLVVSGIVKTCGPLAAVFAVDPTPSPGPLVILFLWLFFWELGGQNIPNDWAEIEEDRRSESKTLLASHGPATASGLGLASLGVSVALSFLLFRESLGFLTALAAFLVGALLLLPPALKLFRKRSRAQALFLFNTASYYPLSLLLVVTMSLVLRME